MQAAPAAPDDSVPTSLSAGLASLSGEVTAPTIEPLADAVGAAGDNHPTDGGPERQRAAGVRRELGRRRAGQSVQRRLRRRHRILRRVVARAVNRSARPPQARFSDVPMALPGKSTRRRSRAPAAHAVRRAVRRRRARRWARRRAGQARAAHGAAVAAAVVPRARGRRRAATGEAAAARQEGRRGRRRARDHLAPVRRQRHHRRRRAGATPLATRVAAGKHEVAVDQGALQRRPPPAATRPASSRSIYAARPRRCTSPRVRRPPTSSSPASIAARPPSTSGSPASRATTSASPSPAQAVAQDDLPQPRVEPCRRRARLARRPAPAPLTPRRYLMPSSSLSLVRSAYTRLVPSAREYSLTILFQASLTLASSFKHRIDAPRRAHISVFSQHFGRQRRRGRPDLAGERRDQLFHELVPHRRTLPPRSSIVGPKGCKLGRAYGSSDEDHPLRAVRRRQEARPQRG